MKYLAVKDFREHQHYRDRNPVWIKLYNRVMDDEAFLALPDAARGHLILIWLLASRRSNKLPNDGKAIARAIQASGRVNLAPLIAAGFLIPWTECASAYAEKSASKPIAEAEQNDSPEREGEREIEKAPPRATVISIAEEALVVACGAHFPAIERFLSARPSDVRADWAADLLQLIGPVTGNLPEDLARACTDGKLATPPVTNARTLRIFLKSCREERVRGGSSPATAPQRGGRVLAATEQILE